jgi:hypothetical protein
MLSMKTIKPQAYFFAARIFKTKHLSMRGFYLEVILEQAP